MKNFIFRRDPASGLYRLPGKVARCDWDRQKGEYLAPQLFTWEQLEQLAAVRRVYILDELGQNRVHPPAGAR